MKQRRTVKRLVTTAILFTLTGIARSRSQEEPDSGVVFFFEAEETDKFYGCAHCYTPDYFGDQYSGGQGPGLCYPLGFVDFLPVPRGKTLIVGYGNGKAASNGVTITINNEAVVNPDSLEPEKWPKHKWWFHLSEEVHGELVVDVSEYLTLDSNRVRIQRPTSSISIPVIDYIKVLDTKVPVDRKLPARTFPSPSIAVVGGYVRVTGMIRGVPFSIDILDPMGRLLTSVSAEAGGSAAVDVPLPDKIAEGIAIVRVRSGRGSSAVRTMVKRGAR